MGMFDSFYFANGFLPDDKAPEGHEFQTKSLGCSLDRFEVDAQGNVVKFPFWDEGCGEKKIAEREPINEVAYVYSHEFVEGKTTKYQEYKVVIVNSKVVYVEKITEEGYDV